MKSPGFDCRSSQRRWQLIPVGIFTRILILKGRALRAGRHLCAVRQQKEPEAKGDSRLSLEERYGDQEGYVKRVSEAVEQNLLKRQRLLLAECAERMIAQAKNNRLKYSRRRIISPVLFISKCVVPISPSRNTKIVIEKSETFANGHEFGVSGAYEKLVGKAYGEIDPKKNHNKTIINIEKAAKNERGRVEYSMESSSSNQWI